MTSHHRTHACRVGDHRLSNTFNAQVTSNKHGCICHVSDLAPAQRLVPALVRAPVFAARSVLATFDAFLEQGTDFNGALGVPWLEIEFEGDGFGDEEDGEVEGGVGWFLGDVAPFHGFVGWFCGLCGWSRSWVGVFGQDLVFHGCLLVHTGVEFFVGDGGFLVETDAVSFGLFTCLWLCPLRDVEHPCNRSDADEQVLVSNGLTLASASSVAELC